MCMKQINIEEINLPIAKPYTFEQNVTGVNVINKK